MSTAGDDSIFADGGIYLRVSLTQLYSFLSFNSVQCTLAKSHSVGVESGSSTSADTPIID